MAPEPLVSAVFRVVVALCGGNIDTTALGRVIERGLAADGRLQRFVATVSDRPGSIAELTKVMSTLGVRWDYSDFVDDDRGLG